jgi:hypothetical protein
MGTVSSVAGAVLTGTGGIRGGPPPGAAVWAALQAASRHTAVPTAAVLNIRIISSTFESGNKKTTQDYLARTSSLPQIDSRTTVCVP